MGKDLYDADPRARALFDEADTVLGRALSEVCFDGPEDELNKTANAQPALFVTSLACLKAAQEAGIVTGSPAFVAGHSLGEYTALAASEAVDFEAGLRLVETRGELTQRAAEATPGRMAALLGLDDATAERVCAEAGAQVCNFNSPGQIVIGGGNAAVEKACALALERGARRAMPLNVAGAFHTSLMQGAVQSMTEAVTAASLRAPKTPLVPNNTACPTSDPTEIAAELVYQLTHPVRWVQCVQFMAAQGVRTFVEFGPGRVLAGLIKRIAPDAKTLSIGGFASLRK